MGGKNKGSDILKPAGEASKTGSFNVFRGHFLRIPEWKDMHLSVLLASIMVSVVAAMVVNIFYGIDILYTHLFYIPIVLAGVWYPRYAVYLAATLGILHIAYDYAAVKQFNAWPMLRAIMFIVVAYVTSSIALKRDRIFADLKEAEEALRESSERLTTVMNSIDAFIYIADMETHELLFVNECGRKALGEDIVGRKCWEALQARDGPCPFCTNDKLLTEEGKPAGVYQWEIQNKVNGKWYHLRDRAIQWTDGRLVRMEIATEITERKLAEEELYRISIHDYLTGVYNRRYVFERLDILVKEYQREGRDFSVSIIDLDFFKKINDVHGHLAGDHILKEFASILKASFRPFDLVGRYGGEEFVAVAMNIDVAQ
ncbi:MAG: sensor domain-containing diguanylate cyclase, partial [Syntrophales bacterium]|nr:sensor domain-containing diguanylate cyclase [Syntrophales bacterium]